MEAAEGDWWKDPGSSAVVKKWTGTIEATFFTYKLMAASSPHVIDEESSCCGKRASSFTKN